MRCAVIGRRCMIAAGGGVDQGLDGGAAREGREGVPPTMQGEHERVRQLAQGLHGRPLTSTFTSRPLARSSIARGASSMETMLVSNGRGSNAPLVIMRAAVCKSSLEYTRVPITSSSLNVTACRSIGVRPG